METKFKIGDVIKIIYHNNQKYIGKTATVSEVIPVFESAEKATEENYIGKFSVRKQGDISSGYYAVKCNDKQVPDYATDDCIVKMFTEDFYKNPNLAKDVLNRLVNEKQVSNMDMYKSGTFLYMDVYDNDKAKEILSSVICDMNAYKKYNGESFVSDEKTQIGLCALQDEHGRFFHDLEGDKEIKWDAELEEFVFAEDIPFSFD